MFFRKQKTVGNDNAPPDLEPTHVAYGTAIDGDISAEGDLHIDGTVRGHVQAGHCVILDSGHVEGELEADSVTIHGRMTGPVSARHVQLKPGADVRGDITSETIAIETGARLSGAVWQRNGAEPRQSAAAALTYQAPEPRFGESLWSSSRDADYRPLATVKPKASGGSRG